jgi:CheY-like chemotaxis protein
LNEELTAAGYDVVVVPNGLRLMAALKIDKPDLLLLDVVMAWINGFDLCRALKRNVDYRDIPVLFISATQLSTVRIKLSHLFAPPPAAAHEQ